MAYMRMNQIPGSGRNVGWAQGSTMLPSQQMSGLGDSKSRWFAWAAMKAEQEQKKALVLVRATQARMEADLSAIQKIGQEAERAVYDLQSVKQSASGQTYDMIDRVQSAAQDVQTIVDEANTVSSSAESEFSAERSKGGNYLASHEGPLPVVKKLNAAADQLKSLVSRAQRAKSSIVSAIGRVKAESAAAAAAAAQQAAAIKEQEVAKQQEIAKQQQVEVQQQKAKFDYEKWQAEREFEMQKQLMAAQQAREEAALRREQEALAREEARAQAEIDREERRRQAIESAEARKVALEEERIIREQEAALRREEREAELEKLMLMQELAAKGMPIGLPGVVQPPMLPGAIPAGYIPPGFVPAPGYPGAPAAAVAPPGYAPTAPAFSPEAPGGLPPSYQQGGVLPGYQQTAAPAPAAPGAPAPMGMEWASFNPASEMFGMGALKPIANPDFTGGFLEEGYTITGPDARGEYTIRRPNGQTIGPPVTAEVLTHNLQDKGVVIYTPPPNVASIGAASNSSAAVQGVVDTLQTAIRGTADVLAAREARKAASYAGQAAQAFQPPMVLEAAPSRSWVVPVLAAGGALAGGVFLFKAIKNLGKK